jgi:lysophospholipase L1-like esterase
MHRAEAVPDINAQRIELNYYSQMASDFDGLKRYHADDLKLPPPAPGENRVVFMGDSITDFWPLPRYFPGKPYINRGIRGQTPSQMLVRFQHDVLDIHPRMVVILGGANDIMGITGPMTSDQTVTNIESMAELAHARGIRVVLCSMLLVGKTIWPPSEAARIVEINDGIRAYAARHDYPFVDYYSALKDANNSLPLTLSRDGIHPLETGYTVMAPLVEAVIEK